MNKKPFWRRVNRGFVVSMALLAVVLVYVLINQLMLIPERKEIEKLTNQFRQLMESTSVLNDEQLSSFQNEEVMQAETDRLKKEVSALFDKDSGYVGNAVAYLTDNIRRQADNIERITKLENRELVDRTSLIDQDVATSTVRYSYFVNGQYSDPVSGENKKISDEKRQLYLSLTFKKTNGSWKIFRISSAWWETLSGHGHGNGMIIKEVR